MTTQRCIAAYHPDQFQIYRKIQSNYNIKPQYKACHKNNYHHLFRVILRIVQGYDWSGIRMYPKTAGMEKKLHQTTIRNDSLQLAYLLTQ